MLTRILEYLLVRGYNGIRQRRAGLCTPSSKAMPCSPETPSGHVVIGHVIEEETHPDEIIATELLQHNIVALTPEARRRHLYVLGATGTGKTNLILRLIESDIAAKRAFCVVDLRGDLLDRILLRIAATVAESQDRDRVLDEWQQRLLLLDMRENEHIVGFNPLIGAGDPYNRALLLLEVLRTQSESWGVQLEETLRNSLLALASTGWSLLEIEPLLTNAAFRAQVLKGVTDSHVRGFFERFEKLSPANQTTWALSVLNKVTPLLSLPQLRLTFGSRRTIDFKQFLDNQPGAVVLVSLAVDRLHHAAHLAGGLLVSSFQSAIMSRVDQSEASRVPVHFYVDEFEMMASERFQEIVAEGRRFGVGLCLSHQNLSQLTPGLRNVLRNNVHTQIYFQTGSIDAAELAKEIIPTTGHKAKKADKKTGDDEAKEPIDARQVLMTQRTGEAYLVRRGQASLRIRTLYSPDPAVDPSIVETLRTGSFANYGRPRHDVESELAQRETELRALSTKPVSGQAPVYEIRHSKVENFKPRPAKSKTEEEGERNG